MVAAECSPTQPRAVLYIPVSLDLQARRGGLAGQASACLAFAANEGLEIVRILSDADGPIELLREQPGLREALRLIRENRAHLLLMPPPGDDDTDVVASIEREVESAGGRLAIANLEGVRSVGAPEREGVRSVGAPSPPLPSETGECGAEGRALEGSGVRVEAPVNAPACSIYTHFEAVAELANNLWKEQNRRGRLRVAEEGRQPHATAPYGYHIPTRADVLTGLYSSHDIGRYIVIPEEALAVQFIFRELLETGMIERVVQALENAGIKSSRGLSRWNSTTLDYLIRNTAYKGEAHYNLYHTIKREGSSRPGCRFSQTRLTTPDEAITIPCPQIVSPEVFDAAQVRLAFKRPVGPKSEPGRRYALLRTLLSCTVCGSQLTSGYYEPTKEHGAGFYYACRQCKPTWNAKSPRPRWCAYPAKAIESMVRDRLIECFSTPLSHSDGGGVGGEGIGGGRRSVDAAVDAAAAERLTDLLLTSAWHIPKYVRHNLLRESGFMGHVTPDPLGVTITFCGHPPDAHPPIVEAFVKRCKRYLTESLRAGLTRRGVTIDA